MEKLTEILKRALFEKPRNRMKLVKQFQESIWASKAIDYNSSIIEVFVNLAHDIEFIDDDAEYDKKLKEEIIQALKKIEVLSNKN